MRRQRRAWLVGTLTLLALVASASVALAAEFQPAATKTQETIDGLYQTMFWISIAVGVLVEAFLVFTVLKWREGGPGKVTNEAHRGSTKVEIAWTIPPTVVFLAIAVLSAQALGDIERPPETDNAVTVLVEASQWNWEFRYPDGTTSSELAAEERGGPQQLFVQEDTIVILKVTSKDVIHSFYVREFGVKIDAIPGTVNTFWFNATKPGSYLIQCAEYCGGAHGIMRGEVVVFEKEAGRKPYGPPAKEKEFVEASLVSAQGQLALQPATIDADQGQRIDLRITNEGTAEHSVSIGAPYDVASDPIAPGETAELSILPHTAGTFDILGDGAPIGELRVREAIVVEVELHDTPFRIVPDAIDIVPGVPYAFHVVNKGPNLAHNFFIGMYAGQISEREGDGQTPTFGVGEEMWLNITLPDRGLDYWCNVPGHAFGEKPNPEGMYGQLSPEGSMNALSVEATAASPGMSAGVVALAVIAAVAVAFVAGRRP